MPYLDKNKQKTWMRNYYKLHPEKFYKNRKSIAYRLDTYRQGAKKRGFLFSISKEQFESFWQKPCGYCGTPLETIGLDRIDNSFGYILSNLISCCSMCNKMKSNLSQEEFINRCKIISSNFNEFR